MTYFYNKKYIKIFEPLWSSLAWDDINERYLMNENDILVGTLLLLYYFSMAFHRISEVLLLN